MPGCKTAETTKQHQTFRAGGGVDCPPSPSFFGGGMDLDFSFLLPPTYRTKPTHTTVNCWFCNQDTVVPYGNRNCWDCPNCEQYNGFEEVG